MKVFTFGWRLKISLMKTLYSCLKASYPLCHFQIDNNDASIFQSDLFFLHPVALKSKKAHG
uniref:Uncharacterized protein n=1 Tax=Solanum lycopersicum TaxID=4081 RepID=A0A3Q7J9B6_SOLLC